MTKHINLQKNYSLNQSGYQLKLPLNIETIIPEDDSVRLLSQFVEAMDLADLYSTYERINSVSPRTLLKIVLYSYMNGDYSSRSMELNCKRDINFMFLLEGAPANKYIFVWKKAVTKNQAKLLIKLADFVAECEQLYGLKIVYGDTIKMEHVKKPRKKLYALKRKMPWGMGS